MRLLAQCFIIFLWYILEDSLSVFFTPRPHLWLFFLSFFPGGEVERVGACYDLHT